MENKIQQPKIQKPKKRKKQQTHIERFVDNTLKYNGAGEDHYSDFFQNCAYIDEIGEDITDEDILSAEKRMSETAIYNAIKNNRRFKKSLDNFICGITESLTDALINTKKNIIADKKYAEEHRKRTEAAQKRQEEAAKKQAEKQAKANKLAAEKAAKEKAQRLIFKECLTDEQKKSLKKFYGLDIENSTHGQIVNGLLR